MTRRSLPPPLPADDDFLVPAPGFAAAAAGSVLRSRRVELGVFGGVRLPQRAWQVQYRTADHTGAPQTSVATLILPRGALPGPRPLMSYQCAIDSLSPRSFPSYALRRGARSYGSATRWELLVVGMALARGWAVVVPDHEGASGNWGVPREAGYCALDAIRAARAFAPFGVGPQDPTVLFGYSGGGLATAWAAELQPSYAPELELAGAVLGSPVGHLRNTFLRLSAGPFGGLALAVVAGLHRGYPDFRADLDANTVPQVQELIAGAPAYSTLGAVTRFRGFDPQSVLTIPLDEFLSRPSQVAMFADIEPGTAAPSCPLLVVQAVHDQIISVDDVDRLVATYRRLGATVDYVRDEASEHVTALVLSVTSSLDWLAARMAARPAGDRTRSTVLAVRPRVWRGLLRHGAVVVEAACGRGIGPRRRTHPGA
ncbi:lipase family protein [Tsukamurella ocularis]|uniref:lipase family protein n=1 Tax=Tsukamurella ocularis TaxID=1970234 RepID=UPI0039EFD6E8